MLSDAGKSYDKTRIVSPYSTRQRFRYYQLQPVHSNKKLPKNYQTLQTNLREKRDSFILRHTNEIVTNTDHSPNYQTIQPSSPRQIFNKSAFERYIGEIRDEDFRVPLKEDCDHRCFKANNVKLAKIISTAQSKLSQEQILKQSQLQTASVQKNTLDRSQVLPYQRISLDLSKKLQRSELKSTEPSLLKKRSKITIKIDSKPQRPKRLKGLSFESSVGHQYSKEIDEKEPVPEIYDIEKCKQSFIQKSFIEPNVYVKFASFRDRIATRYDRADPDWHLKMDTSDCRIQQKDLSYDFKNYSPRKLNEVQSKYPIRASLNLYQFSPKDTVV